MNKVKELGKKWNIISKLTGRSVNFLKCRYDKFMSSNDPDFLYFKDGLHEWPIQEAEEIPLNASLHMNSNEISTIDSYTKYCGFFNRFLRCGECTYHGKRFAPRTLQEKVEELKNIVMATTIGKTNTVFRGVDGYGMIKILTSNGIIVNENLDQIQNDPTVQLEGKVISDPAFLSTSDIKGFEFASNYPFLPVDDPEINAINNKFIGSLFVINVKENQRGISTHQIIINNGKGEEENIDYADEHEFIMPPNQKLHIYKVIPRDQLGTEYNIIYANAIS